MRSVPSRAAASRRSRRRCWPGRVSCASSDAASAAADAVCGTVQGALEDVRRRVQEHEQAVLEADGRLQALRLELLAAEKDREGLEAERAANRRRSRGRRPRGQRAGRGGWAGGRRARGSGRVPHGGRRGARAPARRAWRTARTRWPHGDRSMQGPSRPGRRLLSMPRRYRSGGGPLRRSGRDSRRRRWISRAVWRRSSGPAPRRGSARAAQPTTPSPWRLRDRRRRSR